MGGLSLFTRQVGKRLAGLNSLAFVADVMALFNPRILGAAVINQINGEESVRCGKTNLFNAERYTEPQ
jgi:hypothetical protein